MERKKETTTSNSSSSNDYIQVSLTNKVKRNSFRTRWHLHDLLAHIFSLLLLLSFLLSIVYIHISCSGSWHFLCQSQIYTPYICVSVCASLCVVVDSVVFLYLFILSSSFCSLHCSMLLTTHFAVSFASNRPLVWMFSFQKLIFRWKPVLTFLFRFFFVDSYKCLYLLNNHTIKIITTITIIIIMNWNSNDHAQAQWHSTHWLRAKRNAKNSFRIHLFHSLALCLCLSDHIHMLYIFLYICVGTHTHSHAYYVCAWHSSAVYHFFLHWLLLRRRSIDELYVPGLILSAYLYFVSCIDYFMSCRAASWHYPNLSAQKTIAYFARMSQCEIGKLYISSTEHRVKAYGGDTRANCTVTNKYPKRISTGYCDRKAKKWSREKKCCFPLFEE